MTQTNGRFLPNLVLLVFSLSTLPGAVLGATITLNGINDAGLYPGQTPFIHYMNDNSTDVLLGVAASEQEWTGAQQVYDYAYANGLGEWKLYSAGNIWSPDAYAGENLSDLDAGTYRITPVAGAYMYDGWGWDPDYSDKYWWELHIEATQVYENGQLLPTAYYMLGSYDSYSSPDLAFGAAQGQYQDITLAEGGQLRFWIWDWNSIDNSGSLTFDIAAVPEPSTLLLLGLGLAFLVWRRHHSAGSRLR